jgi:hypothetical protein
LADSSARDCAAVRIGGVEVALPSSAKRTQALGLELFTNLGIDPRTHAHRRRRLLTISWRVPRAHRQKGDLTSFRIAPLARD